MSLHSGRSQHRRSSRPPTPTNRTDREWKPVGNKVRGHPRVRSQMGDSTLESGQRAKHKRKEETENYTTPQEITLIGTLALSVSGEIRKEKGRNPGGFLVSCVLMQPLLHGRHSHPTLVFNPTHYPRFYRRGNEDEEVEIYGRRL